jgi:dephospho-CoA kinase
MASGTLKIGLTGGIGSGKSTVAALLASRGAAVVDTDAIARELTAAGGAALPLLVQEFGDAILLPDGGLDRATMRSRAFDDVSVRQRLEAVLHPMIGEQAQHQANASSSPMLVFDVPLLAESRHWRARVHRVLVVDCRTETQIERVVKRPGWTAEATAQAIAAQSSRQARRAIADAVIFNDGITRLELQAHTEALWRLWNNRRPMI